MIEKSLSLLLAAALGMTVLSYPAAAAENVKPVEASIPFVNHGGVHDWAEDGDTGIYIQDARRNWYHATFIGTCRDLRFATAIGVETRGIDTLDRYATILVGRERCPLQSFIASDPPPKKARHHKKADKPVPAG